MTQDYRRTAKRYRHTSTAASILAVLTTGLGFVVMFTNLWAGLFILGCATVLVLVSLCVRSEAVQVGRLAASQSRMTAWNRRAS
jgi:cytochrome b subunit of formate dehydrogenase